MSLPEKLVADTIERILAKHPELTEAESPYPALSSPMSPDPVGSVKIWRSEGPVRKMVYVGLVVPMIHLDSHMVFAFTGEESAVPHFTVDSVSAGEYYAYHLDLIPRADLATHVPYMDEVYGPLTETYDAGVAREGVSRPELSPRQYAVMSPWMLVARASEDAFKAIWESTFTYLDQWSELATKGLSEETLASLADTDLAARDAGVRANIFSPDLDPVWHRIARMLGADVTERIRTELVSNG